MIKVAVIGCGNMASAVVQAMASQKNDLEFMCYTPSYTRAKDLADQIGGLAVTELSQLSGCDVFMLGMKPQQLMEFRDNSNSILQNKLILSMLTAISLENLGRLFETDKIMRIMPNTPSKLGKGIVLETHTEAFSLHQEISHALSACGKIFSVSEVQLDDLTVFAGSGPAYVFRFAQSLYSEMLNRGFDHSLSSEIIRQLFAGSSELMAGSSLDIQELIDQVTSKGGVTIEAIKVFQDPAFDGLTNKAISAALDRNDQLKTALNSLK